MPNLQDLEEMLRQQVGQPVEESVGNAANAADQKLAVLKKMAAGLNGAPAQPGMSPSMTPPPQYQMPIPEVQNNAPTMSNADATTRARAMIDAPAQMAQASAKLNAQAAMDQTRMNRMNQEDDAFDRSQYKDVNPVPRQFAQIQKKIVAQKPIGAKDIRDSLAGSGMHEVTPELEKQLGYEDEEK